MTTFEHTVHFERTSNWFTGDWAKISAWCYEIIGDNTQWQYYSDKFVFANERDATVFVLKWK